MIISYSVEYAVLGLIYLAKNSGRTIKISEIAEQENIPAPFLQKVFQKLSKAKLVEASVGPQGGFVLAKPANKITLKNIIFVIEPAIEKHTKCINTEILKHKHGKFILNVMPKIYQNHFNFLEKITLKQIIK